MVDGRKVLYFQCVIMRATANINSHKENEGEYIIAPFFVGRSFYVVKLVRRYTLPKIIFSMRMARRLTFMP